jgi:hypothetical protein
MSALHSQAKFQAPMVGVHCQRALSAQEGSAKIFPVSHRRVRVQGHSWELPSHSPAPSWPEPPLKQSQSLNVYREAGLIHFYLVIFYPVKGRASRSCLLFCFTLAGGVELGSCLGTKQQAQVSFTLLPSSPPSQATFYQQFQLDLLNDSPFKSASEL